jgi:guanylate kinase
MPALHNIIVISGPSGCGKSTLIHRLVDEFPELMFSVSHTTRPPRASEVPGKDYHFVSAEKFQRMIRERQFVEWAEVHGHRYGTSWREIRAKSGKGRTLVLDIDSQGARNIKGKFKEAMTIFVVPPTLAALKKRLLMRQGKIDLEAQRRLRAALKELRAYERYDYMIVNDKLPAALADLRCLYASFRLQTLRNGDKIKKLLRGHK